jgi:hypothetical protein
MSNYEIFANENFWSAYGATPDYQERINAINSLIPPGIINLLDIGCGKGDVINGLLQVSTTIRPVGADPFFEAIQFLNAPCVQATLPFMPFADRYFELVMCLQVLEHLNVQDYFDSLLEIQRLSKKNIVIGVPYKENLETLQVLCANCGRKSHAYGHLRNFQKIDMVKLLPDFILQKLILVGVLQQRSSTIGLFFEHRIANLYNLPDSFICPYCFGNIPSVSSKPRVIRSVARRVNKWLTQLSPKAPYWMIAYYRRKGND